MAPPEAWLSKVAGRVVARQGDALTVEFEPDAMPKPGSWLVCPRGGCAELVRKLNQSELLAWVREGAGPAVGEVLREADPTHGDLLGLPSPSLGAPLWPAWGAGLTALRAPPATPSMSFDPPRTLWPTGHAGLDLLAPLAWGGSLALTGPDAEGLRRVAERALGGLCASAPCPAPLCVLVLAPVGARPWWEGALDGSRLTLLQPPSGAGPGALALAWRALWTCARQAAERGAPLLVVLDDPSPFVDAWRTTDGEQRAARAAAQYEALVAALPAHSGAGCTVLALHPEDPAAPPLPGAGGWLPTGTFLGEARFEGDRLEPEHCACAQPLSDEHARQRDAALRALAAREPLAHHASIFGADELDEDLAAQWEAAVALEARLCGLSSSPGPLLLIPSPRR